MTVQRLFGNRIAPRCRYCAWAAHAIAAENVILCDKKGVVAEEYHCRYYRYDPLKREPNLSPRLEKFHEDDFSL